VERNLVGFYTVIYTSYLEVAPGQEHLIHKIPFAGVTQTGFVSYHNYVIRGKSRDAVLIDFALL
jgi:hypothetical protein